MEQETIPIASVEKDTLRQPDDLKHPDDLQYTRVAIALHWTIAALIVFNLSIGYFMEGFDLPLRKTVVPMHISAGITVLALSIARVIWRLIHRPPPMHPALRNRERKAAYAAHFLLYATMFFMPLTGWAIVSANPPGWHDPLPAPELGRPPPRRPGPIRIWGVATLPTLKPIENIGSTAKGIERQKKLHDDFVAYHSIASFLLLALLLLHVSAALKHEWFDGHRELRRMGIGRRKAGRPAGRSSSDAD